MEAVGNVQVGIDDLPCTHGIDEVKHVIATFAEFIELFDGVALVVVGLGLDDVAAFTVDDVADACCGGLAIHPVNRLQFPVHVLQRKAAVVKEQRRRLIGPESQLVVGGLAVVFVAPASTEAHHALGQQFGISQRPAAHIGLMRPLVADVAVAEGPLPVPVIMELGAVHRHHAARAGPELEIHIHILRRPGRVCLHVAQIMEGSLDDPVLGLNSRRHLAGGNARLVIQTTGERHLADVAFLHPGHALRPAGAGATLHPMLHHEPLLRDFLGGVQQLSSFPDVVADGLLHVHMLAVLHSRHGDQRMRVVRRGDRHRVHLRVQHQLPIIRVSRDGVVSLGLPGHASGEHIGIHVAESDDAHSRDCLQALDVACATTVKADDRDTNVTIGTQRCREGSGCDETGGAGHSAANECSAGGLGLICLHGLERMGSITATLR